MVPLVGSLSKGWMAKHLDVKFDRDYYFDPYRRHKVDLSCNEYAAKELGDLCIFYTESNLGQLEHFTNDQVLVGGIQPNMILGMLIGAEFITSDSMDADISMTPLKGVDPDRLPLPDKMIDHEIIKLFDQQIKEIRSQGDLQPIPPFFWDASGRATLHGTLTTAQKFLGESVFIDLMMQPEKVAKVMDWITESFIVLVKHFSKIADLPITSVHIGECSGCMVNPQMFEDVVVPHASRIARELGPLRFHSCGASTHLLESMKQMDGLHALDLGGDTSISKARELFGPAFPIDVAPMPADFSVDTPEPIISWAKQVIEENDGGRMQIIYHLEPDYKIENIRALQNFLKNAELKNVS
ncbi:methylcobalamin:coenzyme M methyltransferase [Anaerohalosphaera lusitana]|uniref:Methylcobalamin:coenzyme M methyltransferase n=1 Tax=Anaerohalosphaera lusitana TaxID=1936003 RepID=A0A1U9NMD0_9BACT|nr:uroporphyrinogen decarboxylase family protein [Anaerohalosphaera lusitana]AQT69081.1 methylcobalamin:coenzyme M methyltransferase [Anaerohalosphaera lusitana]